MRLQLHGLKRLAVLVLVMSCALACRPAFPHAGLAKTTPDHEAVLDQAPRELTFTFMAKVTLTNIRLEIVDGADAGKRIEVRLPRNSLGQSTAYGEVITLPLPPLEPAAYHVVWRAVARDGQDLIDEFGFTVRPPPP